MLAIEIELLSGRYAASAYNDRQAAEWPPHPARLFSALVATWADDAPHESSGPAERAALEWLEQQVAPEIFASERHGERTIASVFVPVNDSGVVSEPSADKLRAAEDDLAAAKSDKERAKAQKSVDKLRTKLDADTAKAIAAPATFGKDLDLGLQVLPDRRPKQPRTFPSISPVVPHVAFSWADATPSPEQLASLQRLAGRLVRLGHSSSLVRATISTSPVSAELRARMARFRPVADGDLIIRWVDAGQVRRLVEAYDRHLETEPRVLPMRLERYTTLAEHETPATGQSSWSSDLIVFGRTHGPRLPILAVAGLSRQFRRALLSHADEPIHPAISGHDPDGTATSSPHIAITPLPVVSGPYADGAVIGIAVVLPRALDERGRLAVNRAIGQMENAFRDEPFQTPEIRLELDPAPLYLQRISWSEPERKTLEASTWCRPSRAWATATPIALDRNPGDLHNADPAKRARAFDEAAKSIVEALGHVGLPRPIELDVLRSCVLPGTAKPRSYPRFPHDPSRTQRVLVHARITFAEPVRGPVLIGAGRYLGLGLCLPVGS